MGNSLESYYSSSAAPKQQPTGAPPVETAAAPRSAGQYVDEYDVQTKTWRRVPLDAEDEFDVVAAAEAPGGRHAAETVKKKKKPPRKKKLGRQPTGLGDVAATRRLFGRRAVVGTSALAAIVAAVAARLPTIGGPRRQWVRVDRVWPADALDAYGGAALRDGSARVEGARAFRYLLDDLKTGAPAFALTFALVEDDDDEEDDQGNNIRRLPIIIPWLPASHGKKSPWRRHHRDAVVLEKRRESGLLKCSVPESPACALAFKPVPPRWRRRFVSGGVRLRGLV